MRKRSKNYGFRGQKEAVALRKKAKNNFSEKCTREEIVNSAGDLCSTGGFMKKRVFNVLYGSPSGSLLM